MIRLLVWIAVLAGTLLAALALDLPHRPDDPATIVFEGIRVVVALLAGYLLLATALAAVDRVRWATPRSLRRFVRTAVVAGVIVSQPAVALASDAPVMRRVPTTTVTTATTTTTTAVAAPAPTTATTATTTWKVEKGQHLWSIAASVTAERLGRRPTTAEIDPVWRTIVRANRHRFPDPDLIHPGDEVTISGEPAT